MRKLMILVLLLAFCLPIWGHPPAKVELSFDKETMLLMVTVEHQVSNPENHYVVEVNIEKNKKEIIKQMVSRQETPQGSSFVYKLLDVEPEDVITVTASCSKFGSKKGEITIK